MKKSPVVSVVRRMARQVGSGTIGTLAPLLLALWVGFAVTIGDRFFSVNTLQSMAFQMPELGILSLAMMLALLSGGLNLSIIATANLTGLTIAFLLTRYIPGTEGIALRLQRGLWLPHWLGSLTGSSLPISASRQSWQRSAR